MSYLLDVNLLVAVAWPCHIHHAQAISWLDSIADQTWGTSLVTELGFVRVSSNPSIIEDSVSPIEAFRYLTTLKEFGTHRYFSSDLKTPFQTEMDLSYMTGHRLVTDFHLISLAKENGAKLATLDQKLCRLIEHTELRSDLIRIV